MVLVGVTMTAYDLVAGRFGFMESAVLVLESENVKVLGLVTCNTDLESINCFLTGGTSVLCENDVSRFLL